MEYFRDIDEIKKYVGSAVNQDVYIDNLMPSIQTAYHMYIADYFSEEFYMTIRDVQYDYIKKIADQLKKAVAHLGLHEYAKIASVKMSDRGMMREEHETYKGAYRYQEKAYRQAMLLNGYNALDEALRLVYVANDCVSLVFLNRNGFSLTDDVLPDGSCQASPSHDFEFINI